MAYPLTTAQTHLGELVAEARQSQRPVTISEHGKPVAALINIDDLADLEDRAIFRETALRNLARIRGEDPLIRGAAIHDHAAGRARVRAARGHALCRRAPRRRVS